MPSIRHVTLTASNAIFWCQISKFRAGAAKKKTIDYTKVHQSSGCASQYDDGLCRTADHGHLSQVFFVIARGILQYVQSGSIDFENRTTSALDCDERGGAAR